MKRDGKGLGAIRMADEGRESPCHDGEGHGGIIYTCTYIGCVCTIEWCNRIPPQAEHEVSSTSRKEGLIYLATSRNFALGYYAAESPGATLANPANRCVRMSLLRACASLEPSCADSGTHDGYPGSTRKSSSSSLTWHCTASTGLIPVETPLTCRTRCKGSSLARFGFTALVTPPIQLALVILRAQSARPTGGLWLGLEVERLGCSPRNADAADAREPDRLLTWPDSGTHTGKPVISQANATVPSRRAGLSPFVETGLEWRIAF